MKMSASLLALLVLYVSLLVSSQIRQARVEHNSFFSSDNPRITVEVDRKLKYVGSVPFTIDHEAAGYRYIFVQTNHGRHIAQMFIIQQEGFLATSNDTYKYPITRPVRLGNFEYQHSVFLYDNSAAAREQPGKEAWATQQFLADRGYSLDSELIMSRFARPADSQHKHEIIFFCFENLASYGHKLTDFPEGTDSPEKQNIKARVDENCRGAFHVTDKNRSLSLARPGLNGALTSGPVFMPPAAHWARQACPISARREETRKTLCRFCPPEWSCEDKCCPRVSR